ncbi:MAG TPA: hypothetical protein VGE65_01950 [Sphingobium sp.]
MNPWPFVIAAYAITLLGAAVTSIWAWRSASDAETRANALKERD